MNKRLQKVSIVPEVNIFVSSQKHNLRYNTVLEQRREGMFRVRQVKCNSLEIHLFFTFQ